MLFLLSPAKTLDYESPGPAAVEKLATEPQFTARAAELIFTGRTLSAEESLELGLTNAVVPDAEIHTAARAMAREIADNAPLAVQSAKRLMRMGLNETFNDHVHHVYLQFLQLMRTRDFREGMVSFLEKRPAEFTGR
jgi:enoyl-CoA hydratase/carnithine racemase